MGVFQRRDDDPRWLAVHVETILDTLWYLPQMILGGIERGESDQQIYDSLIEVWSAEGERDGAHLAGAIRALRRGMVPKGKPGSKERNAWHREVARQTRRRAKIGG